MVFNCNMSAFSRFTTIINLYIENLSLEMTIKKLGSVYKFRVGRATGNEHIFCLALNNSPSHNIFYLDVCCVTHRHKCSNTKQFVRANNFLKLKYAPF